MRTHKYIPVHTDTHSQTYENFLQGSKYRELWVEFLIDWFYWTDERFQEVPKLSNYLTKPVISYDIKNKEGIVHVTDNDGICKPL